MMAVERAGLTLSERIQAWTAAVAVLICTALGYALFRDGKDWSVIISAVSSVAGIFGLPLVLIQLYAVKRVANAAAEAARDTAARLDLAISIADVVRATKMIEQVQSYAGDAKYELARSRLQDVRTVLLQLGTHPNFNSIVEEQNYNRLVGKVGVDLNNLYAVIYDPDQRFDAEKMSRTLESIVATLVKFEHRMKFPRS